jgi:hypothetical protein
MNNEEISHKVHELIKDAKRLFGFNIIQFSNYLKIHPGTIRSAKQGKGLSEPYLKYMILVIEHEKQRVELERIKKYIEAASHVNDLT